MAQHPTRDALDYESPSPAFALSFSPLAQTNSNANVRLAIGSYLGAGQGDNFVTVVGLDSLVLYQLSLEDKTDDRRPLRNASTTSSFVPLARAQHQYPVTALSFGPATLASTDSATGSKKELIGTTSDCLRIWEFVEDDGTGSHSSRSKVAPRMVQKAVLQHAKSSQLAPLTSFSWCPIDTTLIATSSVDTTCSIWDIASGTALTQLIAHDKEVFDVAWSPTQRDVFASVGADGSVRMFDLRSLEHSTILYEKGASQSHSSKQRGSSAANTPTVPSSNIASPSTPLLRLAYNPSNSNMLAVFHANSNNIQVLDVRSPGVPQYELKSHKSNVNGICWSLPGYSSNGNGSLLGSCSDDSQVLLWDIGAAQPDPSSPPTRKKESITTQYIREPTFAYSAPCEVSSMAWSGPHANAGGSSFVAVTLGRTVRCLRI